MASTNKATEGKAKVCRAVWNGVVVAESSQTKKFAGQIYFPPDSIQTKYFLDSSKHTQCPFKGQASYKSIQVKKQINKDAAWFYPQSKEAAKEIEGYVAFWKGVHIEQS